MMQIKSAFSKISRSSGRNFSSSIETAKATVSALFVVSCGYGGFISAAAILPSLVDGDAERFEEFKACTEELKGYIRKYDEELEKVEQG